MSFIRFITTLFSVLLLYSSMLWAEGGLGFYSYGSDPEFRTGLSVPASDSDPINFKRSVEYGFDMKLRQQRDVFGYVNRLLIDDAVVDLLVVKPRNAQPTLVATSAGGEIMEIVLDDIYDWNLVSCRLDALSPSLVLININGTELKVQVSENKHHSVRLLFGSNDFRGYQTSDVAPISIKDLYVKTSERETFEWPLNDATELEKYKTIRISAKNPDWTIEQSRHWSKVWEFRSQEKMLHAFNASEGILYVVSNGHVNTLDLDDTSEKTFNFSQFINTSRLANDLTYFPEEGLAYVDVADSNVIITKFNEATSSWNRAVNRSTHSLFEHHNALYNPSDSTFLTMFGYGQHRYYNDLNLVKDSKLSKTSLDQIPPRYLSSVGTYGHYAYVLGGKGNPQGVQELGIVVYDDIYRIDLLDYSTEFVTNFPNEGREVAADRLIVSEDGRNIVGLFYSPNVFKSSLHLKSIDLSTGEVKKLGDSVPYDFLDINSDATLIEYGGSYYALTVSKESSESFVCSLYRIVLPIDENYVEAPQIKEEKDNTFLVIGIVVAVLLLLCLIVMSIHVFHKRVRMAPIQFEAAAQSPGIHLLGAFKVYDNDGNNITSQFTPTMRQLLSLVLLHTADGNGLSNSQMKDALWFDKSEERFFNNRGVNLTKIRNIIKENKIKLEIVSENGVWKAVLDENSCDYIKVISTLKKINDGVAFADVSSLSNISSLGRLLPDMKYDWLDKYKESYDGEMIRLISELYQNHHDDKREVLALADALMTFDSLNVVMLREKCKALIELERIGVAKSTFEAFKIRYQAQMGEDFQQSFAEFVK